MRIDGSNALITLEREQSLRVEAGVRIEVCCASGVLWVTQAHDVRDLFLARGERVMLTPRGLALLTALERSEVELRDLRPTAHAVRTLHIWLGGMLAMLRRLRTPPLVAAGLTLRR